MSGIALAIDEEEEIMPATTDPIRAAAVAARSLTGKSTCTEREPSVEHRLVLQLLDALEECQGLRDAHEAQKADMLRLERERNRICDEWERGVREQGRQIEEGHADLARAAQALRILGLGAKDDDLVERAQALAARLSRAEGDVERIREQEGRLVVALDRCDKARAEAIEALGILGVHAGLAVPLKAQAEAKLADMRAPLRPTPTVGPDAWAPFAHDEVPTPTPAASLLLLCSGRPEAVLDAVSDPDGWMSPSDKYPLQRGDALRSGRSLVAFDADGNLTNAPWEKAEAGPAAEMSDPEAVARAEGIVGQPWEDDRDGSGSELGERAESEVWAWAQRRMESVGWFVSVGGEEVGHGGAPTLDEAKAAASRVIIRATGEEDPTDG